MTGDQKRNMELINLILIHACRKSGHLQSTESLYSVSLCMQRGWDRKLPGIEPGTLGHWGHSKLA